MAGNVATTTHSFDLNFGGESSDQVFIGRQPILDAQQKIIGYELLFRSNGEDNAAHFADDFSAGAQVLVNTLNNMGTESLMGDKFAFLRAILRRRSDQAALLLRGTHRSQQIRGAQHDVAEKSATPEPKQKTARAAHRAQPRY